MITPPLIAIVALSLAISASAQKIKEKKHRIEIGLNRYHFYNVIQPYPYRYRIQIPVGIYDYVADNFEMLNLRYSYSINSKLALYLQYNRAATNLTRMVVENYTHSRSSIGKLVTRDKYNFFDLGAEYKLYQYRKHKLTAVGSLSFAQGKNTYLIDGVWVGSPEHIIAAEYSTKKESYFGGSVGLRYNYTFWKNRMNVGANFSARYYNNDFPFQINYGAHVGYNF